MAELKAFPKRKASQLTRTRVRYAWLFLLPMLIVLATVALYPLVQTIYLGFTNAGSTNIADRSYDFVGFDNYLRFDERRDKWRGLLVNKRWWGSVLFTVKFAFTTVLLETMLGLVVALVMNAKFRGRAVMRAVVLVPWAIPTIVSAQLWAWMLHDQAGVINDLLVNKLGIMDTKIAWTSREGYRFWSVVIVDVWKTTPFMALLILAGMQMLPKDIYEAAKVDGVHPVRVFFRVTLPLIRPALMVAIIFRALDALRVFDLLYVLIGFKRGSTSMSFYAQQAISANQQYGVGSAAATLVFMFIALITIIYIYFGKVDLGKK